MHNNRHSCVGENPEVLRGVAQIETTYLTPFNSPLGIKGKGFSKVSQADNQ